MNADDFSGVSIVVAMDIHFDVLFWQAYLRAQQLRKTEGNLTEIYQG